MPPVTALLSIVITADIAALILLWTRVRTGSTGARLVAEGGISTLALFALLYGLLMATQRLLW